MGSLSVECGLRVFKVVELSENLSELSKPSRGPPPAALYSCSPRSYLYPHVAGTAAFSCRTYRLCALPTITWAVPQKASTPTRSHTLPLPLPSSSISPLRGHPLSKFFLLLCSFPQSHCSSTPVHTLIILCHSPFLPPDIEFQPETHKQDLLGTRHFAAHWTNNS